MSNFKLASFSVAALISLWSTHAQADCFQFEFAGQNPVGAPTSQQASSFHASNFMSEIWCYEKVSAEETLIYFSSGESLKPELSALVQSSASGAVVSVAHGSLSKGKVSYVKASYQGFSPIPVPLTATEAQKVGQPVSTVKRANSGRKAEVLLALRNAPMTMGMSSAEVEAGTFKAYLPAEKLPFGGYWWPNAGFSMREPMRKYDRIVESWTGISPHSVEWEAANHNNPATWGGHCNGWAASALLYSEMDHPVFHEATQTVIKNSDFNALLAESNYCVNYSFYGQRYDGNPGDDLLDISPDLFHKVLTYFIATAQKGVIMDIHPDEPVDNQVISGYRMVIKKDAQNAHLFHVEAALRVHT